MKPKDRMDILGVQRLYGHVLDRGMRQSLDEIFLENGTFDPSDLGLPVLTGMSELRENLTPRNERFPPPCHHATNIIFLEQGASSARVLSKYLCDHPTGIIAYGEYEDDMVRTDRGWRIKSRTAFRRGLGKEENGNPPSRKDPPTVAKDVSSGLRLESKAATGSLTLEDQLDLMDLQNLYGHVLDRGLWARIGEIFAEDGIFDPSDVGLPPIEGLTEIREKLIPLVDGAGPTRCHHTTNSVIIEATPNSARMLNKYICSSREAPVAFGEYEDDVVKTPSGWRIKRRKAKRRSAHSNSGAAAAFVIDWDTLLENAPPRPALAPLPTPPPLSSADRLDLLELVGRYGHMFDRGWRGALDDVFTPDMIFDPSAVGLPVISGLEAFRNACFPEDARLKDRAHHGTNLTVLSATADGATLLSKYIVRHPTAAIAYGEYEDHVVRTAKGWRIKRRKAFRRALGIDDGKGNLGIDRSRQLV